MIFNTQFNPFSLDISDKSLKLVQIISTSQGLKLNTWNKVGLPEGVLDCGEIKNETELIKNIKKLINNCQPKIKNNYVVACLPETKTFIKLINLETSDSRQSRGHLNELVKQELPRHIPLPIENIYFDWQVINQNKNNFEVLIGVAPKEIVDSFSQLINKCDLTLVALEIEAQAIIRSIFPKNNDYSKKPLFSKEYNWQDILKTFKNPVVKNKPETKTDSKSNNSTYLIIDFGACRSGLIVWADKTIKFTSSLKICGNHLTDLIAEKMGLDINKAEKLKNIYGFKTTKGRAEVRKILIPAIKELCQEINKAKNFYQTHFSDTEQQYKIILTGGSSNLSGLEEYLSDQLGVGVSSADPTTNLIKGQNILMPKDIQTYTTAIGLALRPLFIKDV